MNDSLAHKYTHLSDTAITLGKLIANDTLGERYIKQLEDQLREVLYQMRKIRGLRGCMR